jgi:hypothetical protein
MGTGSGRIVALILHGSTRLCAAMVTISFGSFICTIPCRSCASSDRSIAAIVMLASLVIYLWIKTVQRIRLVWASSSVILLLRWIRLYTWVKNVGDIALVRSDSLRCGIFGG